jgi:hypothetical protein
LAKVVTVATLAGSAQQSAYQKIWRNAKNRSKAAIRYYNIQTTIPQGV